MIETKYKAASIGVYVFLTTITGTICDVIIGKLVEDYALNDVKILGYILAASASIPCLIATLCFYKSGLYYAEFKTKATEEKAAALIHADSLHVHWRKLSVDSL